MKGRGEVVAHEFNVLALVKGEEKYIFVYDDASRAQLFNAFRDQAADPALSLTWFDAVVLTDKAREQQQAQGNLAVQPSHPAGSESRIPQDLME